VWALAFPEAGPVDDRDPWEEYGNADDWEAGVQFTDLQFRRRNFTPSSGQREEDQCRDLCPQRLF
jgi:hypothetical protein